MDQPRSKMDDRPLSYRSQTVRDDGVQVEIERADRRIQPGTPVVQDGAYIGIITRINPNGTAELMTAAEQAAAPSDEQGPHFDGMAARPMPSDEHIHQLSQLVEDAQYRLKANAELTWTMEFWQRQLRLQDWDVEIEYADSATLENHAGQTWTVRSLRKARLKILDPREEAPESMAVYPHDVDTAVVHELLHLKLDAWRGEAEERGSAEFIEKEAAIEQLAGCLVAMHRGDHR